MADQDPDRAKLEEIAQKASRVAHDLNNLVSVILGYANLLVEQVSADSPARRMAEEVQTAAHQAAALTRTMVELRREQKALEKSRAEGAVAAPPVEAPKRGNTVLIVEDDPGVRRLAESILTRGGFTVLLAAEGGAAVKLAEGHPGSIDLLLADVVLPGSGGGDIVNRVKTLRPEVRVLFMSGYSVEGNPETGSAFLPKPFSADVLLSRVKSMLGEPRS